MEAYLSEEPIDSYKVLEAIRKATVSLELVPVLCGSALRNKGIQPLLDAIIDLLPSPVDIPPIQGTDPESGDIIKCQAKDSEPLAALIFKVAMMEGRKLSFVRVYSGKMKVGEELYNPSLKKKEKLTRILQMHAQTRTSRGGGCRQHCGGCRFEGVVHRRNPVFSSSSCFAGRNRVLRTRYFGGGGTQNPCGPGKN